MNENDSSFATEGHELEPATLGPTLCAVVEEALRSLGLKDLAQQPQSRT